MRYSLQYTPRQGEGSVASWLRAAVLLVRWLLSESERETKDSGRGRGRACKCSRSMIMMHTHRIKVVSQVVTV